MKRPDPKRLCHRCTLMLIVIGSLLPSHAAFELNFLPVQNPTNPADFLKGGYSNTGNPIRCPDSTNPDCLIGTEDPGDPTLFYYERVDGYWHIVIGDPSQGFAQETYTPILGLFHSATGGHEPVLFTLSGNLRQWSGNGWDPLEFNNKTFGPDNVSFSGNGTGVPMAVVVRQVLGQGSLANTGAAVEPWGCSGGGFCQEFLKAEMDFKPVIWQSYDDGTVAFDFFLDMSHIRYDDMATPAVMTNTVTVVGAGIFPDDPNIMAPSASHFDMAVDSQDMRVSAGRYIYHVGNGWYDDGDGDNYRAFDPGSYEYWDGGFSDYHLQIEWSSYFDATQNPAGVYPGNESRCAALNLAPCSAPPTPY